jgi:hypothetical protein
MADAYLTIDAINKLFQGLTIEVLALPFITDGEKATAYSNVRISWPIEGQPAWKITDDVVFLKCVEVNSTYNKQRDVEIIPLTDLTKVEEDTSYTRTWNITWTIYGPLCADHARQIKSGLFHQSVKNTLDVNRLFMIPEIEAPRRSPELYQNRWWERCDLSIYFNESVHESINIGTVKSVETAVDTVDGVQIDVTIE